MELVSIGGALTLWFGGGGGDDDEPDPDRGVMNELYCCGCSWCGRW